MAGHTKGPWEFVQASGSSYATLRAGEHLLTIFGFSVSDNDGRLIAAAPDLLEAALEALAYCEHIKASMFGVEPSHAENLRAAIAKAEQSK